MAKPNKNTKRYRNHRKEWSTEDIEILRDKYGRMNTEWLAKELGRTVLAVNIRAKKIFKNMKIHETQCNYSVKEIADTLGTTSTQIIRNWIKKYDMPVIKITSGKNITQYIVEIDSFWDWLKNNKENVTVIMNNVRTDIVEYFPEWFLEDLDSNNNYCKRNKRAWSPIEEELLEKLYYKDCLTIREIAKILDRSYRSVADKISHKAKKKLTKIA